MCCSTAFAQPPLLRCTVIRRGITSGVLKLSWRNHGLKGIGEDPRSAVQQCDPDHQIAASCRSCDLELMEHSKNVTLTIGLLPAAEIVTLNYW